MIRLKNSTGLLKECTTGFSWTNLLFGCFVPLFRGDWKWFLIQLIASLCTSGISMLVFPFFYNNVYIKMQLENGFSPADEDSRAWLEVNKLIVKENQQ